ncbi:hypothetical protein [Clostridium sp. BL-8]|uniref:hypothetical protein n=1 Tax=Clostridium sp. BL-8 TaxID=349938 RepID=UPI00098C5CB3|nr:hypothetical protein [Clostridium sp. BL-8]OOM71453.1 hypothetical protein CLOBL_49550 [Clostridium sp. BL-8]
MEMKTFNIISIGIKLNYSSEIDEKTNKIISNKIITGLKRKLVPYDVEELINEISVLRLKLRLKKGVRCEMTEPRSLIDKMIIESLSKDKELVTYMLDVEAEELDVKPE